MKPINLILAAIAIIGIAFVLLTLPKEKYPTNGSIINSGYVPAEIK